MPFPRVLSVLFPNAPRHLPGRRGIKITLRAGHASCAALLVGAYWFGAEPAAKSVWLHATIGSGALLLALDLHETFAFLCQLRGVVLIGKLLLLAAFVVPPFRGHEAGLFATLLFGSVLASHAPSRFRHYQWLLAERAPGSHSSG